MTNKVKRYSEVFQRQVVSEYEAGNGIPALQRKYAIGGSLTVQRWIRKYGSQGFRHELVRIQAASEYDRIQELEKQVKELQTALGRMTLEKLKLESTLEVLQETAVESVKKNDPVSSRRSSKKPSKSSERA